MLVQPGWAGEFAAGDSSDRGLVGLGDPPIKADYEKLNL